MSAEHHHETLITGIPLWVMEDYLRRVGAMPSGDEWLHPEGWKARLEQAEDYQIGSLRVGRIRLTLYGSEQALEQAQQALAPYLLRGGG